VIPALLGVTCRVVKNSHVIAVFCRNAGLKKDVQCLRLRLAFNPLLERMVPLCVLRDPPLEGLLWQTLLELMHMYPPAFSEVEW